MLKVLLVAVLVGAVPSTAIGDPVFRAASVVLVGGHVADLWSSRCAVAGACREVNPVLRPFTGSSAGFGAVKAGLVAAQVYMLAQVHRKSRLWGRVATIAAAGGVWAVVAHNRRVAGR